ncbi:SdpI family protein [Pseudostreptobacillus hongkongensis]|uniref:SdpI family protein n=1 Tax=Pseudostreptobacillus hongkongensis TaxID=1162717 RepID=UPI0008297A63|nr:SdpI family protein [Pseudostreptobacillus hongkongensis]
MLVFMPILMIILGYLMKDRYPVQINNNVGYRTKRAKISNETWIYAQKLFGKLFLAFGVVSLVLTICFARKIDISSITALQVLILLLPIAITELLLRTKFDDKGNRKG